MPPRLPLVVVDTNILFSALLREDTRFGSVLLGPDYEFSVSELVLVEIFDRKEKLLAASKIRREKLTPLLAAYLRRIRVFNDALIPAEHKREALRLCRGIDESDAPHVALALMLQAPLWTGDRVLRTGLEQRGFTTFFTLPPTEQD